MKWALITGASAGLGEEFAWQFAAEPLNIVLVARRADRLENLANRIRATLGVYVEVLPADLSTKAGQYAVVRRLHDDEHPVAVLVNNAGFGLGQSFFDGEWKREETALEVMGRAVARLSLEGARAMHGRGGGAILNVSSATAYTAMGSYAALKTWVRFFSESLSTELKGTKVSVTTVCPGLMNTEFHEKASMDASVWPKAGFVSTEEVVRQAIEAARKRRVLVTPTVRYKLAMAGARFAPRWFMRRFFGSKLFNRALSHRGA